MDTTWQHTTVLLNEAIEALLTRPDGTFVDATFGQEPWRRELRDLGDLLHARLTELECVVPGHVADARLRERGSGGDSDATPLVRAVLAEERDGWPEARVLDCRDEPHATVAHALAIL